MKVLSRLIVFALRHWKWSLLAFISMLGTTIFSIISPWVIRTAIDTIMMKGSVNVLFLSAAILIGASVLRGICGFSDMYFSEIVSQKTAYDLRNAIFKHLQQLSFDYYDKNQTGQLMSRATADVEAIRMFFGRGLLHIGQLIFLFVGISFILISMNWKLALITLLFLPILGFRAIIFSLRLSPIWLKVQQLLGVMGTILEENLTGVRVVKAFCKEEDEVDKFSVKASLLYDEQIMVAKETAFNMPLITFIISLPTALILWYGGLEVIRGNLTIGGLTQFILYLGMLVMPVRRLVGFTYMVSRSIPAGQRILEILDTKSSVHNRSGARSLRDVKGEVCFENVTFSYDSTVPVLDDISFCAKPGELVALVGSLGSGKSSLAHLIPRFYDVNNGRITIDGLDIRDVTLASLRRNVGIVQQEIYLFSDTIEKNIAYGKEDAGIRHIEAAAKAAYLHDFVISLPDGYDTWVGERGITLSGGEKQRLAIARTILTDPRILILDDSTSSVDPSVEHLIREALDRLIKGRTTFIITHRLPIIRSADLILVLNEGRISEHGKHHELMDKDGFYKQIYESQVSANSIAGEDQ